MLIIPILDYLRTKFDISHTFTQKFPSGQYKKELNINHHKLSFKLGIDCFLHFHPFGPSTLDLSQGNDLIRPWNDEK